MSTRDEFITKAKIAEQAQLYDDMRAAIKSAVEFGDELSNEERNILSVAYKHVCGAKRMSWRVISSIEQKAEMENASRLDMVHDYREKIEMELEATCIELIMLLDSYLLKSCPNVEQEIFYNKMKGDYNRYLSEIISVPEKRKKVVSAANRSYSHGFSLAIEKMQAIHPVRLGLSLNYAVFLYEIKNMERKACILAKTAFDEAIAQVEMLRREDYKDSTMIMQYLRDNLNMWSKAGEPTPEDLD